MPVIFYVIGNFPEIPIHKNTFLIQGGYIWNQKNTK